eukprot:CAMPEP_0206502082 /NCGR_PEP_ID=MMETSP0324_2-20121206/53765_1 /ASSEMBLY_ACC=CAM_ASM_000836 /TAXON_ID=2866 /ORGANISM="Crypthecodinium cohnii, Strain Seligo" /LENGTH=95 /DNA_ID=CAMNT_0053990167 /DNA_START=760 /DNA_END=1047 /DNA_ORIENTATION=+
MASRLGPAAGHGVKTDSSWKWHEASPYPTAKTVVMFGDEPPAPASRLCAWVEVCDLAVDFPALGDVERGLAARGEAIAGDPREGTLAALLVLILG